MHRAGWGRGLRFVGCGWVTCPLARRVGVARRFVGGSADAVPAQPSAGNSAEAAEAAPPSPQGPRYRGGKGDRGSLAPFAVDEAA